MKTFYITDLDGTLLDNRGLLSEESRDILKKLINSGLNFSVATARTFATVLDMFHDVNLKLPIVLMNGAMIYDPVKKEVVRSCVINKDTAKEILGIYKVYGKAPMLYFDMDDSLEIRYSDLNDEHQQAYINNRAHAKGKNFVYSPSVKIKDNEKLIYMVALDKYENLKEIYERVNKINGVTAAFYSDNYSDCYFLEIFSENASKAISAKIVKDMIEADRIIAFGDNLNDIPLFEIADESYAVSNACTELKNIATEVIGNNNENSVAKYIENKIYMEVNVID